MLHNRRWGARGGKGGGEGRGGGARGTFRCDVMELERKRWVWDFRQ